MKAQVKQYNGTPTIFLDDQPIFAGIHWIGGLDPNFLELNQQCVRNFSEAGIHIYSIDAMGAEWCGPRPGSPSHFDFSPTAPRLQAIVDADPDALFLLRLGFETRYLASMWWGRMYKSENELLSNGKHPSQSFASTVWQAEVKDLLTGYISELRRSGMYDRVIAYQICTGTCGEWIKDESSMGLVCGDYSEPMKRVFRAWLGRKYANSQAVLQAAWADPAVTFETAEIPTAAEQLNATHLLFRDPKREMKTIDFYDCYAEMCADSLLDFCQTVKKATAGEKLTGAFFGYIMDLSWNNAFFGEKTVIEASEVSTVQRSGHLGLQKVLRSPDIDFLVSPYGYAFRGLGGDGLPMQPTESLRTHGKIYLLEEDTTMHNNFDPGGRNQAVENTIAVIQRNFAQVATHGIGVTWLENSSFLYEPPIRDEAHRWIKRFEALGEWSIQLNHTPQAEVAVFLDDESYFYESIHNNIDIPLIWQQRVVNLNRFGAPHDVYLLNDLLEDRLPEYKLYVFLNPFFLNARRREKLKSILRRNGKTALWLYAPGYINENGPQTENITDLTGFQFGRGENPWGPFMHITNFSHPITQGLSQELFWGTTQTIGPLFHLEDTAAVNLGQVVYSMGRCKPGFGVKTFNPESPQSAWNSVYIATPNVPSPVLRGIARFANVHIYSEAGDVLYATPDLLSVHSVAGGRRTFKLPKPAEAVYDLFNSRLIGHHLTEFNDQLQPASTALYFTGSQAQLDKLLI
jgi:hypothetical protein